MVGRNKNRDDEKKTKRKPIIAPAITVRLLTNTHKTKQKIANINRYRKDQEKHKL